MITYDDLKSKLQVVRNYGGYFSAFCPFHDDRVSPSLLVFKDGWFKCLSASCNRVGNWVMLWNKTQGQNIRIHPERRTLLGPPVRYSEFSSLEELCYQSHIDLQHFTSWQWYLENRKLDDMIDVAEIGYYRGWYTFPVYDANRKFITAVFRSAPHVQESTGLRYWCNTKPAMYAPDYNLVEKADKVIVVFGILDALSWVKLRFPAVTSTAGADTFKASWLKEFRKPIYIIPDEGEEETALKLSRELGWRGRLFLMDYPRGIKDTNDYLVHDKEKELLRAMTEMESKFSKDKKGGRKISSRILKVVRV